MGSDRNVIERRTNAADYFWSKFNSPGWGADWPDRPSRYTNIHLQRVDVPTAFEINVSFGFRVSQLFIHTLFVSLRKPTVRVQGPCT